MKLIQLRHSHHPRAKKNRHIFVYHAVGDGAYWEARGRVVEMQTWCEEQFGPSMRHQPRHVVRRWHHRARVNVHNAGEFQFAHDDDAFAFKMRWC